MGLWGSLVFVFAEGIARITYTVCTATALPFSMMTLSTLVLQAKYRLECWARVEWM